ncbi:MAG: hypothetical protein NTW66_02305 [Candidatus Magasanikbacteria bacterium]|nr:hypothetical protein [Candidatus Magasanikbacteria bacterium]
MVRKRGREHKFTGTGQGGNPSDDAGDSINLADELLRLDPSSGETAGKEAEVLSREAKASAGEMAKQVDEYLRLIQDKKLNELAGQMQSLDRLSQEMRLIGDADIATQGFQDRIGEWKAQMRGVSESFNRIKEEVKKALEEAPVIPEAKDTGKKNEVLEISKGDLQSIVDYYSQDLLSDRQEAIGDADLGVLSRILSGEKLSSEEREQKAVKDVLFKLRQHFQVAELLWDRSDKKKIWGPRHEKLKKLEHIFSTRAEKVKIVELPEPSATREPSLPDVVPEKDRAEKGELKTMRPLKTGDVLVEKNGKITHEVMEVYNADVGGKNFKQYKVLTRANSKAAEQVLSEKDLAGLKIIRTPRRKADAEPSAKLIVEPVDDKAEAAGEMEIKVGQKLRVKRTSGEMEDGWEVVVITGNTANVRKKLEGTKKEKFIIKTNIPFESLREWNASDEKIKTKKDKKGKEKAEGEESEEGEKKENKEEVETNENIKKEFAEKAELMIAEYTKKIELVKDKYPKFYAEFFPNVKRMEETLVKELQEVEAKMQGATGGKKKSSGNKMSIKGFLSESEGIFEYQKFVMETALQWLLTDPEATRWIVKERARVAPEEPVTPGVEPAEVQLPTESLPMAVESPAAPAEEPVKKSWWQRAKEKIGFVANKETGKVAADVAYKTVTSVFGVKTATDLVGALAGVFKSELGFGDIHKHRVSASEMKGEKALMKEYLKDVFEGGEKIEEKMNALRANIESATHIAKKDREALLNNLQRIASEYTSATEEAAKERDKKVESLLKIYMKNKVSGMTLAKDLLNTALTATGMSMVRGAVYASMSVGERLLKSEREFEMKKAGRTGEEEKAAESKAGFVLKDLTVNAAVETARSLVFMGAKKETKGAGRVIDFMRAAGTVARGFGIYGLALTDSMSPAETLEAFMSKVGEQGITCTIKDDFIVNAERAIQLYAHPIDTISSRFGDKAPAGEHAALPSETAGHGMSPEMAILQKYHLESVEMDPDQLNQAVIKLGQLEKSGVSLMALQQLAEGGITPEEMSAMDNVLALANGRPEVMAEFSQAIMAGHSPQEIFESTQVHKGDGLERVLQRQLKMNPEALGFKGDLNDQQAIQRWAGHEASVIAQKQGLADKYFVFHEDRPQFLVLHKDGSVDVGGRLYQEIPKPPAELAGETTVETGDKVNPVQELIDAKTGQPVYMTDAERSEYDRLVRNEDYDNAMAYMLHAKEHGPVYELSDGREIHRSGVTEWVGGKPEIVVTGDVRIGFTEDETGLRSNTLNVTENTNRLYENFSVNLAHNGMVQEGFTPAYVDEGWGTRADEWVMKNELIRATQFYEALNQTSDPAERQALLDSLHRSILDASASAGVHPDQMFNKEFLDKVHYGEEAPVRGSDASITETGESRRAATYEEIVRRAQEEVASTEETAPSGRTTADVEQSSDEMFDDLDRTTTGFNRFFDKGANFHERMTVLRETLKPGERTYFNNVEYLYDGGKVHYKMGSIVGILDTPQEANALADMDYLYRMKSMEMQNSDSEAAKDFTRAMDVLRGGSDS